MSLVYHFFGDTVYVACHTLAVLFFINDWTATTWHHLTFSQLNFICASYDLAPSHILSTELYLCHINLLCHCIVITTLFQHLQWSLQTKGSWLKTGFQYFRKDIELTESEEVNRRATKLVKKMRSTCITVIDWNIWGWCVFIQQGSGVI